MDGWMDYGLINLSTYHFAIILGDLYFDFHLTLAPRIEWILPQLNNLSNIDILLILSASVPDFLQISANNWEIFMQILVLIYW